MIYDELKDKFCNALHARD